MKPKNAKIVYSAIDFVIGMFIGIAVILIYFGRSFLSGFLGSLYTANLLLLVLIVSGLVGPPVIGAANRSYHRARFTLIDVTRETHPSKISFRLPTNSMTVEKNVIYVYATVGNKGRSVANSPYLTAFIEHKSLEEKQWNMVFKFQRVDSHNEYVPLDLYTPNPDGKEFATVVLNKGTRKIESIEANSSGNILLGVTFEDEDYFWLFDQDHIFRVPFPLPIDLPLRLSADCDSRSERLGKFRRRDVLLSLSKENITFRFLSKKDLKLLQYDF